LIEGSSPLAYSNGHSDHQKVGSLLAQYLNLMLLLPVKDEKGEKAIAAKDEEEKKLQLFLTILKTHCLETLSLLFYLINFALIPLLLS